MEDGNEIMGREVNILNSDKHPLLQELAELAAFKKAAIKNIDFDILRTWRKDLRDLIGDFIFDELAIVAPNCIGDCTTTDIWEDVFKVWGNSPETLFLISKKSKWIGAAIARSTDGGWYAVILMAN
jgi:hypothetical protein